MAIAKKVTKSNHLPSEDDGRFPVYSKQFNELVDVFNEFESTDGVLTVDTISESTSDSGVTIDGVLLKDGAITTTDINNMTGGTRISANVVEYTKEVTITSAEIVGTAAGDLGHAIGTTLIGDAGSGTVLQFVNAVLVYDYSTAAYTGGAGDDLTIYISGVPVSGAIATADLITKAGDAIINLSALTTDHTLTDGKSIYLKCTPVTNPGTAAGVIRVYITYRIITTGL